MRASQGKYDGNEEESLAEKARFISEQFLSSPIPPKCRINCASRHLEQILENISLGMFNRSLFHDLTITTFPLLLNYWKKFCEIRHQYVPKSTILKLRREHVITKNRKKYARNPTCAAENDKLPLIDYCSSDRFTGEHVHISRSLGKCRQSDSKLVFFF